MDKPSLLSVIQANIPETYSEYRILDLVESEINKQIQDKINGIISKKPIDELRGIIDYIITINSDRHVVGVFKDAAIPGISDDHIATKSPEESKVARLPAKLKKRK